jgi:hypothetical protein
MLQQDLHSLILVLDCGHVQWRSTVIERVHRNTFGQQQPHSLAMAWRQKSTTHTSDQKQPQEFTHKTKFHRSPEVWLTHQLCRIVKRHGAPCGGRRWVTAAAQKVLQDGDIPIDGGQEHRCNTYMRESRSMHLRWSLP